MGIINIFYRYIFMYDLFFLFFFNEVNCFFNEELLGNICIGYYKI